MKKEVIAKFYGAVCDEDKEQTSPLIEDGDKKNNIVGGVAVDRLKSIIERVEHLEDERKALNDDIRDVLAEAKSAGFSIKPIRTILKIRKMNPADREEQEHWIELYKKALDL